MLSMWLYLKTLPQYLLPQHTLSRAIYHLTRIRWAPWKNLLIRSFIRHYKVDMHIAEQSDNAVYPSFNDFFTRALKPGVRPLASAPHAVASPVDGSISQCGHIRQGQLIQAKGRHYSLRALLANDTDYITQFRDGHFSTIYLSPRDYHRIHLPVDARLLKMTYVPGDLFSVNAGTTEVVDQLFARNERLICQFDTAFGKMAVILVGAIFVGGMETVWQGEITPAKTRTIRVWDYPCENEIKTDFRKGEELGRFNMGSTVILLFEQNKINWCANQQAGSKVQLGEQIASGKSN